MVQPQLLQGTAPRRRVGQLGTVTNSCILNLSHPQQLMLLQRKVMAACVVSSRILFRKNFSVPYKPVPAVSTYLDL